MQQIKANLLIDNPDIAKGLIDGSLKRFGGVIRDTSNGQIRKHLLETSEISKSLMKTPAPNVLGEIGQQALSSVLQVSQIAAAASVLNLGVSVAGFAYMGYKLNQLQTSMAEMQESMDAGFDRVDSKLNTLGNQLNYLLLLAKANANEQQQIRNSLAELRRVVLITELAELRSWLEQLSRFPEESPKDAIRVASKVRQTLSDQALREVPEFEPRVMLVADISIRGWAVATVTEANLLMSMGQHRDAQQLIEAEHPRFASLAQNWTTALLTDDGPQLKTAYRFVTPHFQEFILPERVERIARLHQTDRVLTADRRVHVIREAELELDMSYNTPLDENWRHRQLAIAEYLDGLSELSSRIESTGSFAKECEIRNLPSSRSLLPGNDVQPGLYLLSPANETEEAQ